MARAFVRFDNRRPPITGVRAFERVADDTVQQQAAVMLLLGQQLRGDPEVARARARARGRARTAQLMPARDRDEFPVPRVPPARGRLDVQQTRRTLDRRYGRRRRRGVTRRGFEEAFHDVARRLYRRPTAELAAQLLEMALGHPDELGRVAAAAAYFAVASEPARPLEILVDHLRSRSPTVREIAATSLAGIAPDHPGLQGLLRTPRRRRRGRRAHTSAIVHGTFAADAEWWQPNGDFHKYLIDEVRPDVYAGGDRFGWSGGYSDGARALAAADFVAWVNAHAAQRLDVFGHSHGASVLMLATHGGLQAGRLILLSCPVHPDKYFPNFANAGRVISIRVRLDLVILADRGGQRFADPRIEEHVLPIWFEHSATRTPDVWRQYNLPSLI